MPFDYKKEYKAFYLPPKKPHLITVPPMNFVAVRGKGDPNDPDGEYQTALELLYGLSYTIKMSCKGSHRMDGYFEYVVPPLEGLWHQPGAEGLDLSHKESFVWTSMIRLPDFVTRAEFDWAVQEAAVKKKRDFSTVQFFPLQGRNVRAVYAHRLLRHRTRDFAAAGFVCSGAGISAGLFRYAIPPRDLSFRPASHRTGKAEDGVAASDLQKRLTENFTKAVAFSCKMCYTKSTYRNISKKGGEYHAA